MISQEAIQKILGIEETVHVKPEDMVSKITLTIFPYDKSKISPQIKNFADKLTKELRKLGVRFIPYNDALVTLPPSRIVKVYLYAILDSIKKLFLRQAGHDLGLDIKIDNNA